jgi:hypothetical protein
MSEELKPCQHGRNFCMECHYDPKAPRSTLPQMLDDATATIAELRAEVERLRGAPLEAVTSARGDKLFTFMSKDPCRYELCEVTYAQPVRALIEERNQLSAELDLLRGDAPDSVGLFAIHYFDNWDGEGDTYHLIARKDEQGRWFAEESCKQLLQYEGDRIIKAWPLSAAPTAKEQGEWIACAERLPERGQHIVVRREGKTPFAGAYSPLDGMHRCLDRWSGKWWEFSMWLPAPQEAEQESERFSFAAAPSRQGEGEDA